MSSGNRPAVALTDTGEVYVTHSNGGTLYQTVGTLSGNTITLQDFIVQGQTTYMYDQGSAAHVATNGKVALQMFHIGDEKLVGNAALLFDRANWMGDQHDGVLKGKTMRQIAFPGSHDAGAFAQDIAQSHDLSIREQLRAGVRYFDLRPEFSGDKKKIDVNTITTYHDIGRNPAGTTGLKSGFFF